MKDIDIFWPRFFQYATLHNGKPMPRHYQEAAYLYGHLENKVDISHMPFDQEVKDSYQRFMEFTQQCAGMTEAQMAEAFRPQDYKLTNHENCDEERAEASSLGSAEREQIM